MIPGWSVDIPQERLAICAKAFWPPKSLETTPNPKFFWKSGVAPKSSRNSHWIHTKRHAEFHWIPLNFPEIFLNFLEFAQTPPYPWNFRKIRGGEEFTESAKKDLRRKNSPWKGHASSQQEHSPWRNSLRGEQGAEGVGGGSRRSKARLSQWLFWLTPPFCWTKFPRKKTQTLKRSFRKFCRNLPRNFWCFPGRSKSLPANLTRYFTAEISNFKSNVTKKLHNALLQAWQP